MRVDEIITNTCVIGLVKENRVAQVVVAGIDTTPKASESVNVVTASQVRVNPSV
jgi:hypothetical protein